MQRERRVKPTTNSAHRFWIGFWIVVLLIICASFIVVHESEKPMDQARQQTITMARKYAGLVTVDNFYAANLNQTYYSVAGTNNKNQKVYVIVAKQGGGVTIIDQNKGITDTQVRSIIQAKRPTKINSISLTLQNKTPFWVVSYLDSKGKLCFATLSFKNGNVVSVVSNI